MKILKIMLLFFATLIMSIVIRFIADTSVIDMISVTYVLIVNAFLGVDLASMIKDSTMKPKGEWADIKMYRYILVFICLMWLFVLTIYMKESHFINPVTAMASFGSGAMLVIGMVMAGLSGNKIASKVGPDDTSINN